MPRDGLNKRFQKKAERESAGVAPKEKHARLLVARMERGVVAPNIELLNIASRRRPARESLIN